jgi:acyl-coenzyme A thioesterase PaaI-like protein
MSSPQPTDGRAARPRESLRMKLVRWGFNFIPAYWGTGARLTFIADDFRDVRLELPLSWRTRNYVGTIFGGSMYAAVDPVYMVMLIKNLGPDYVVWDKAACVRFRKPGRAKLYARFTLSEDQLECVRRDVASSGRVDSVYQVILTDRAGTVHAEIDKIIHVRRRETSRPPST